MPARRPRITCHNVGDTIAVGGVRVEVRAITDHRVYLRWRGDRTVPVQVCPAESGRHGPQVDRENQSGADG